MSSQNSKGPCKQRACESRGISKTEDPNAELSGRPLLFTGVLWIHVMRRFLLPRRDGPCDLIPPTEDSKPINVSHVSANAAFEQVQVRRNPIQQAVPLITTHEAKLEESTVTKQRELVQKRHSQISKVLYQAKDQVRQVNEAVNGLITETKAATAETIDVIRQEDAAVFRYGVITLSGFVGYLFGLRRGAMSRWLYSATGATAAAAICYPKEIVHYNQQALNMVHKFVVFGIEFGSKTPNSRIENTGTKKNNLEPSSKNAETPGTTPQPDRQPTKLTSDSFISPENDFKHYQNYYEGTKPRPKADRLQKSEKVKKVEEKNTHSETHPPLQSSNQIPKPILELPAPTLAIPEETIKKIEDAPEVSPPSEPFQETTPLDTFYPPIHGPNNRAHRSSGSKEKLELKPKTTIVFLPEDIEESLTKPESEHHDEVAQEKQDLLAIQETVPDFNINSDCLAGSDTQVEEMAKDILIDQYVPLNKKLSRYYKKNPDNMTVSINEDDINVKKG